MANVVFSVIGTVRDRRDRATRWNAWRPTVAMCQQDDFKVDQLELFANVNDPLTKQVMQDISEISPDTKINLHNFDISDHWDFSEVYLHHKNFVSGYDFDVDNNNYFINISTGTHTNQICWFLLTESRDFPGTILQVSPKTREGKNSPIGSVRIIDLDLSQYDEIVNRFNKDRLTATDFLKSGIKTQNPQFNSMIDDIEKIASRSTAPFLLMGPTGSGKSHLAKQIFSLKSHKKQISGNFIEINCATLTGDQAMSILFGHVAGAFTGASKNRNGLLKSAHNGVIFLDEIGELGLDEQAMILRAIEEKRFRPLGSDQDVQSDFQLIAGTNIDLKKAVAAGKFRADLLARINLWTFTLPALKDRREDILPNIYFELDKIRINNGYTISFNKEALELYMEFALSEDSTWDMNFRDLSSSICRMGLFCENKRISTDIVRKEISMLKAFWKDCHSSDNSILSQLLGDRINEIDLFDRGSLETVVETCMKSKSLADAGRKLFACSRQNKSSSNDADRLKKYLARFDLTFQDIKAL